MDRAQPAASARPPIVRMTTLAVLLILSIGGLVYSRKALNRRPPEPPASATIKDRIKVYTDRIKADKTDVRAYVELGRLEESQEFYTSALRRLYAARVLGAEEREIILPLGRSLSRLARWDEAFKELTHATRLMPASAEAAANLAGAYAASGDSAGATRVLSDFVERNRKPDGTTSLSLDDLRRVMICFVEAHADEKAGEIAKLVIAQAPDDAGAYAVAGNALLVNNKFKDALPYLEKAVALEPSVPSVAYNDAIALEQCGRETEALKQLERCVSLNQNAVEAFTEMASLYAKRKQDKLAALAITRAAFKSPADTRILYRAGKLNERAGSLPEANYWYAKAALSAAQYGEALKYAAKLVASSDPRWRSAGWFSTAEACRGQHKMSEYLEAMRKAHPGDSAQDCMDLADAYQKADLLDKQVEYLRKALARDPRRGAEVHSLIADTLARRGLPDQAEREMELAVAADPSNPENHTQLGNLYLQRRSSGDRLRKAIREYSEAVRLEPGESSGYQNLGVAYSAARDWTRAAAALEHAIDLEPGYGPAYQELGRVYAARGDVAGSEEMRNLFRKYVHYDLKLKTLAARADQNRKDPAAQTDLADLQARSGDLTSALQNYEAALRLAPNDARTRRKRDRVMDLLNLRGASEVAVRR